MTTKIDKVSLIKYINEYLEKYDEELLAHIWFLMRQIQSSASTIQDSK